MIRIEDICEDGLVAGYRPVPPDPEQVEACRLFVRVLSKRKHKHLRHTSYQLKAYVEMRAKTYISNGAFIKALMLEGFSVSADYPESPNAVFNISARWYQELLAHERAKARMLGKPMPDFL